MIKSRNGYFIDEEERILIFKGCNFSADSKIPSFPDGATHNSFSLDRGRISFTGRPCPLNEADEHFERMKRWGFNFLRFLITWEAIEPEKPGVYDTEYLDYVKSILEKAANHGFYIYIDPHQDIYSRFSGGDGAPWWTFDKVGIDVEKIGKTFSAFLHKDCPKNYPSMIWPTNYNRYAAATMFTLFFGGNDFAAHLVIDGQNIQDYLQIKYINAIKALAQKIKDNKNIVGFGSMNEPHPGYIGYTDLNKLQNCSYAKGAIPTGFESMKLASGYPVKVNIYNEGFFGYKPVGKKIFNKEKISVFKNGFYCPWLKEGVWDIKNNEPILLKPDYFSRVGDRKVNFGNDYLKPFILRFQKEINSINDNWFTIIEGIPHGKAPEFEKSQTEKMIHGFHWYDGLPMVLKVFFPFFSIRADNRKPVFGKKNIIKSYYEQVKNMKENTEKNMGNMPCLLGEFGLPFDIFKGLSYKIKNFYLPNTALSMFYDVLDKLLISSTIWTYCVANNHRWGDNWNKEDFSIYCKDDSETKRATPGFLRPYPLMIKGIPIYFNFDRKKRKIVFKWINIESIDTFNNNNSTKIFIPDKFFPDGFNIDIFYNNIRLNEDLFEAKYDNENQILSFNIKDKGDYEIIIHKN